MLAGSDFNDVSTLLLVTLTSKHAYRDYLFRCSVVFSFYVLVYDCVQARVPGLPIQIFRGFQFLVFSYDCVQALRTGNTGKNVAGL